MSIEIEEGQFYTLIGAPHLIVSKAVVAKDRLGKKDHRCSALSPTGDLHELDSTRHRPATEAEIMAWHMQKVAYLHNSWYSKQEEADHAKEKLEWAKKEAKLGLSI